MTQAELRFRALVESGDHSGDCDNCGMPLEDEAIEGADGFYCTPECRSEAEDDTFREDDEDDAYVDLDLLP